MLSLPGSRVPIAAALLSLTAPACAAEPPPAVVAAPTPTAEPVAAPTAAPPAAPTPTVAPSASAVADAPPRRLTAAEIMASVPDKAGTIDLPGSMKVTIDAKGRVIIIDSRGESVATSSCGANGFDYKKSVKLFAELRDALHENDRDKVATLVLYPLRVNEAVGKHRIVKDPEALKKDFEQVFPEAVSKAIEKAEPRAIFCRSDGFMLGDGVVWAETKRGRYGLFVVNP